MKLTSPHLAIITSPSPQDWCLAARITGWFFGGVPRTVRVPVEAVMAVFARENGQGMAFEPEEPPPQPTPTDPSDDDKPSKGSHLKVVK